MTWGEFKKAVEELGAKDADELDFVDYDSAYRNHSGVTVTIVDREDSKRLVTVETAI